MHDVPDLGLLRLFTHLHRERHLTRAARRAGITQPAMSRALGRMRTAFGDPLFVRGTHGMTPTPRADALAPQIHSVLEAAAALVQPQSFDPGRLARNFVVATSELLDTAFAPRILEVLAHSAPGVSMTTRPIGEDAGEALATGRLDLIIGVRASVPNDAMTRLLFEDRFVCTVRRNHSRVGKRMSLDLFCELPHLVVAPRGVPGGLVDRALAAVGRSRRIVMSTHTFSSAPAIIARSDLLLTAPSRVIEPVVEAFELRTLTPPLEIAAMRVLQAWHPRVQHDSAHAWFRGVVARAAAARRVP